jgi:hypothetical protein
MAADKVLERAWGKPREYDPDSSGKRYSEMSPEEREREIARLIAEGRTVIEQAKPTG